MDYSNIVSVIMLKTSAEKIYFRLMDGNLKAKNLSVKNDKTGKEKLADFMIQASDSLQDITKKLGKREDW